jgi:hypothetical protein
LRALGELFASPDDQHLGLYGAFGYDLVFQFEPIPLRVPRPADQRDLVLYLPDEILIVDHMRQQSAIYRYEFEVAGRSTSGLPRATPPAPYRLGDTAASRPPESDHAPGEYAALVRRAKEAFALRGRLKQSVSRWPYNAIPLRYHLAFDIYRDRLKDIHATGQPANKVDVVGSYDGLHEGDVRGLCESRQGTFEQRFACNSTELLGYFATCA